MNIEQSWFHNKTSYEAFVYAVSLVEQINKAKKEGAIIYYDGAEVRGEFKVILDTDSSCIGVEEDNCFFGYVGYCWDCKTGKIRTTKQEVKEAFKQVAWVFPKDFHKLIK